MRAAVLVALVGCGGGSAHADAAGDAAVACTAQFSGNFAETSSSPVDCATVMAGSDVALGFAIESTTLVATVQVAIDLGATPSAGVYSSDTVQTWSAMAFQSIGNGGCEYSAGSSATPTGSFTLALDAIDAAAGTAHGTLDLVQYVLTFPGTNCGSASTESLAVTF